MALWCGRAPDAGCADALRLVASECCSVAGARTIVSTDHIPHPYFTMSLPDFSQAANLTKLDGYLADKSYVDG